MADLDPLIRYRKHEVDEKQRVLAELYRLAEDVQSQKDKILQQMEKEKAIAKESNSVDTAAFLGKYLDSAYKHIETLDHKLKDLDEHIEIAQENMREAFAELKKIEITSRNREDRERAEEKHKEDMLLDDMAIESYRRKLDED